MFQMSTYGHNACPQPKSPSINCLINHHLSGNQTLPQLINISQDAVINKTDVGYVNKHRFGAMMKSGVSQQSRLMAVHTRCASVLCYWNL